MIRVRARSRLHFGLLSFNAEEKSSPGSAGVLATRRFGSIGLMVQQPGIDLRAWPDLAWSASGPLAERTLTYAREFSHSFADTSITPVRFEIAQAAPEHIGLGTGTQLALAVAQVVSEISHLPRLKLEELALRTRRGLRSAVGIHGFSEGGFLVEGGKIDSDAIAPMVARVQFPENWRVVLILPPWKKGLHGVQEVQAFEKLGMRPAKSGFTAELCQLVLLCLLPALIEKDLQSFGQALYEFNFRVGEAFSTIQGSYYASPLVAELVAFVRREGISAVGQSSWGPAVFAITDNGELARRLAERIQSQFKLNEVEVLVTTAANSGAEIERFS